MDINKVANITAKLLYKDKQCVYENLDKVEKRVKRINDKLNNDKVLNFNTNIYNEESLAEFFALWIESVEDESIGGSNRKILDNLGKLDWSIDMENAYAIFISREFDKRSVRAQNIYKDCIATNDYIKNCKNELRNRIRYGCEEYLVRYKQAKQLMDQYVNINVNEGLIDKVKKFKITEEVFSHLLIQTFIYGIANNQNIGFEMKEKLLKNLKKIIDAFEVVNGSESGYGVCNDFAIKLFYLNRRKELETEVDIVNRLIEQSKEEGYVKYPLDKYKCDGRIIKVLESKENYIKNFLNRCSKTDDFSKYTLENCQIELEKILTLSEGKKIHSVLDIKELKEIITEGDEKEKTVRFKEKLEMSWRYCEFLQKYAGRQLLPFYLQHIKVIYKEIFIDKMKFNKRTAHTIMLDLEERVRKDLDAQKSLGHDRESYFLLEKINRGFYREKGNLSMYNHMGDIRIAYYSKILKIYQFMNIEEALCYMKRFIEYINEEVRNELSGI